MSLRMLLAATAEPESTAEPEGGSPEPEVKPEGETEPEPEGESVAEWVGGSLGIAAGVAIIILIIVIIVMGCKKMKAARIAREKQAAAGVYPNGVAVVSNGEKPGYI